MRAPKVVIFDVNETLLDIEAVGPVFADLFGDGRVLREWFAQLLVYSMSATLAGQYVDFFTLGRGVLHMVGAVHGVAIGDDDWRRVSEAFRSMPAHPDVEDGLTRLRDHGYRLVTLTNSPPVSGAPTPLETAGLDRYVERQFSVDTYGTFKPARALYVDVAAELEVAPQDCMMVAAHIWDTMGAQSAGMQSAFLARPGNALIPTLPQPTITAADVLELARLLGAVRP
ncbi:haloacid dehalogenase type II [Mycolicibacterium sp. 018/SC-01/001]|uniref:haloacid dehalogenase type II n=1 Tax=Mycolicibacterium sp. 018/SC-01/001 TaxID=2592069 RepID=UPI00117C49A7|nr:haloacid dehalogenase type II [Mycolicibacterium sp. 018/SC-01/001]TRW83219.1 haloacid dehalogenase type II [Mycolicibacterium sp. 018/SC-01/001]